MAGLFGGKLKGRRNHQEVNPQSDHLTFSNVVNRAIRLIFFDDPVPAQPATTFSRHELMTNASVVCENEKRLSLVFEDLSEFPFSLVKKYSAWVQMVDLSHNRFSDVRFLENFDALDAVILDHNLISSASMFPRLPSLKTLWLNYNRIHDLGSFLDVLAQKCPNLVFLSLMGNKNLPTSLNGDPPREINKYRMQVIGYFPKLRYLDDRPVSQTEREIAVHLRESKRLSVTQVLDNITSYVENKLDRKPSLRLPHNGVV